jgi:hypothetical protein
MPINRMLQHSTFNPDQVRELVHAYESVLVSLNLTDRTDPATELIARAILECATAGELDRAKLHDCALQALMKR